MKLALALGESFLHQRAPARSGWLPRVKRLARLSLGDAACGARSARALAADWSLPRTARTRTARTLRKTGRRSSGARLTRRGARTHSLRSAALAYRLARTRSRISRRTATDGRRVTGANGWRGPRRNSGSRSRRGSPGSGACRALHTRGSSGRALHTRGAGNRSLRSRRAGLAGNRRGTRNRRSSRDSGSWWWCASGSWRGWRRRSRRSGYRLSRRGLAGRARLNCGNRLCRCRGRHRSLARRHSGTRWRCAYWTRRHRRRRGRWSNSRGTRGSGLCRCRYGCSGRHGRGGTNRDRSSSNRRSGSRCRRSRN